MAIPEKKKIEILLQENYISTKDLESLGKINIEDVIQKLISGGNLSYDLVGQGIAEHYKIKYFDLNSKEINRKLLDEFDRDLVLDFRIVPVEATDKKITVTTDEPDKKETIEVTLKKFYAVKDVEVQYSVTQDIERILENYGEKLSERLIKVFNSKDALAPGIFVEVVKEAKKMKASDIHFIPNEGEIILKFRVDGLLKKITVLERDIYENIVNRIKVLAKLRIDEKYKPQDGSIRMEINTENLDLRVSIAPIVNGEKIVIRILSDYLRGLTLEELGMNPNHINLVSDSVNKSYGMILVTGPTGSGKTTTLYSLLKKILNPSVNITTIEDPVEYRIKEVSQIQVNKEMDLTFANGLRSIVRQDPDVILVGEIRDKETAEIAVNAALTGHLLLSTFHATDASTAIPRLLDMDIQPFLLASTIRLIISQRLVRKIDDKTKQSRKYTFSELKKYVSNPEKYFQKDPVILYEGKGNSVEDGVGYKGRIAIYEMMYITPAVRDLISKQASSSEIWEQAKKEGAISFFEDGMEKVKQGLTTIEELSRVASEKDSSTNIYGTK